MAQFVFQKRGGIQQSWRFNSLVASVEADLQVTCSRSVKLVADKLISEVLETKFDLIALPGILKIRNTYPYLNVNVDLA